MNRFLIKIKPSSGVLLYRILMISLPQRARVKPESKDWEIHQALFCLTGNHFEGHSAWVFALHKSPNFSQDLNQIPVSCLILNGLEDKISD